LSIASTTIAIASIQDYDNRSPKTDCVDYGLLITHIIQIKNNLGVDICILPNFAGFNMQKHDDQHKL
jgi:hypothetical protein